MVYAVGMCVDERYLLPALVTIGSLLKRADHIDPSGHMPRRRINARIELLRRQIAWSDKVRGSAHALRDGSLKSVEVNYGLDVADDRVDIPDRMSDWRRTAGRTLIRRR